LTLLRIEVTCRTEQGKIESFGVGFAIGLSDDSLINEPSAMALLEKIKTSP
jgi:hypothetical protein